MTETVTEWRDSSQWAINLVTRTLELLELMLRDVDASELASELATWGNELLELTAHIKGTVEAPSDLQQRMHWAQFLNLSTEIGKAARSATKTDEPQTLFEDLGPRLASEISTLTALGRTP